MNGAIVLYHILDRILLGDSLKFRLEKSARKIPMASENLVFVDLRKPWGKPLEKGKTIGKPWENYRKTIGKWEKVSRD